MLTAAEISVVCSIYLDRYHDKKDPDATTCECNSNFYTWYNDPAVYIAAIELVDKGFLRKDNSPYHFDLSSRGLAFARKMYADYE